VHGTSGYQVTESILQAVVQKTNFIVGMMTKNAEAGKMPKLHVSAY